MYLKKLILRPWWGTRCPIRSKRNPKGETVITYNVILWYPFKSKFYCEVNITNSLQINSPINHVCAFSSACSHCILTWYVSETYSKGMRAILKSKVCFAFYPPYSSQLRSENILVGSTPFFIPIYPSFLLSPETSNKWNLFSSPIFTPPFAFLPVFNVPNAAWDHSTPSDALRLLRRQNFGDCEACFQKWEEDN